MNAKSKVKPKRFRIARSIILLLIIVLISISGISRGGVSPFDPNFTPTIIPQPVVPQPIVPPITPLPTIRRPADGEITGTSLVLIWPSVETATSYNVYLCTSLPLTKENLFAGGISKVFLAIEGGELGATYYWRVDWSSDGVFWNRGVVWDFQIESQKARDPYPAHDANDVTLPLLQWTAGINAISHNVYLGTSPNLTEENLVSQQQEAFYFIPTDREIGPDGKLGMQPNTTYYWRIDEVLDNNEVITGEVWRFKTEANKPSDYPTLVAWWPYDEDKGSSAMDLAGLRVGTIIGTINEDFSWGRGNYNSALEFVGGGAHVEAPFVRSPADGPLSVFCWVKGNIPGQVIASQQNGVNWLMASPNGGYLMTELPGPETAPLSTSLSITDNSWHHVGVVWDGEFVNLYVDGHLEEIGLDRPTPAFTFGRFYTGRGSSDDPDQFWQGLIDDLQVYGYAFTDKQIEGVVRRDTEAMRLAKESVTKIEADSYQVGPSIEDSRKLAIDLNFKGAVGAIAKPGVTKSDVNESAAKLGLEVVEFDERSRIVRLALPYDTSRPEVAKFTTAARQTLADSNFTEIGLTVTPTGARSPMILTNKFIVQLKAGASIDDLIGGDPNVIEVEENPYRENQYLIEVNPDAGFDALQASHSYANNSNVVYAVANFASVPEYRGDSLPVQWHLNDEPNDADIDAQEAWDLINALALGNPDVNIAVIDTTVDHQHPDLIGNLWKGQGTNNFGYTDNTPHWHGTAVAGCVGANGVVKGSCPNCKLMLLRCNLTNYDQHKAFNFAKANGADVICCSWGYATGIDPPVDVNEAIREAAEQGRGGLGCVIVFAMTNEEWDNGNTDPPDISSLEYVIAVSGSTDKDQCGRAGYGDCMEVLAPTSGKPGTGTRSIVTTDVRGAGGYNPGPVPGDSSSDFSDPNYTRFFGGTSAACATTAGVAGLILSVDPNLTREQVQYLLQHTADKIEPSKANYNEPNGFSRATIDDGTTKATHGYGRVNAYEAVRVAAQGVDVFLRDNKLDWGNTEQPSSTLFEYPRGFIPYWESPDINVADNGIEVRVHNRGVCAAESVDVELYYCIAGTALPQFSSNNSNQWTHLGNTQTINVPYPGSADASFPLPDESNHYCLLAMVQCDKDLRSTDAEMSGRVDANIPNDNNISLYNVVMIDSSTSEVQFYIRNPYPHCIQYKLEWDDIDGAFVYLNGHFSGDIYNLKANTEESETLNVSGNSNEDLRIRQIRVIDGNDAEVMGGLTFRFKHK